MIQSILPCLTDPLLCELFFKNYIKYKNNIDKLLIVVNHLPGFDYNIYQKQLNELVNLIKELDVKNYKLLDIGYAYGHHAHIFSSVINDIKDPLYHCYFDEQDSFLVNNSFSDKVKLLDNIDLIGCERTYFIKSENINCFNEKYNVKHNGSLYTLHLPQFLSNRIIKKIDDLSFDQRSIDIKSIDDVIHSNGDQCFLDTFQYINLQVYKKTDQIKIYDYKDWCVSDSIYENKNINFDTKFIYHAQASRLLMLAQLFHEKTDQEMESFLRDISLVMYYEVNLNFYYQALEYLKDFKYRDIYIKNFNKIKHKVNLNKFDCSDLIKKII
jgi:hypothetical protein